MELSVIIQVKRRSTMFIRCAKLVANAIPVCESFINRGLPWSLPISVFIHQIERTTYSFFIAAQSKNSSAKTVSLSYPRVSLSFRTYYI